MIDYKGREVLCSVRNMEVTFGKGRKAFVAVKGVNFDIYKGAYFRIRRRIFFTFMIIPG